MHHLYRDTDGGQKMSKDNKRKTNPDDNPDVNDGCVTFRSGSTKVQAERRKRAKDFWDRYYGRKK